VSNLFFQLQSLDDLPLPPLLFQEEDFLAGVAILFLSFFYFQGESLGDGRAFSVDLYGPVPTGVGNPIKGLEISPDPLLKLGNVFLLVLIGFGDTREVKGKVSFLESLLSSTQDLMDFLFFRNLAG
jgi:hypothetical protein